MQFREVWESDRHVEYNILKSDSFGTKRYSVGD